MDISKIKNLVKQNGDKFIFVENGEPEIVMMSFKEYEKLAQQDANQHMRQSPLDRDKYDAVTFNLDASSHLSSYSTLRKGPHDSVPNLTARLQGFQERWEDEGLRETELVSPFVTESVGLPVRLEDIRLEDLPI